MNDSQYGNPLVLQKINGDASKKPVTSLRRCGFKDKNSPLFEEKKLQEIIHEYPEILPINETEPAFQPVIPVCMELGTSSGSIDNFFITPNGNLIFAECKLWKNPQAIREVVAQVLDYIQSLSVMTYEELEKSITSAIPNSGTNRQGDLYQLVSQDAKIDESEFVDAVSRNLRQGRGLFFIIGDGVKERMELIVKYLQNHAHLRFALTIVEIALYHLPENKGFLAQPRILAKTLEIERNVIDTVVTR